MDDILLSLIVCTRNRNEQLSRLLRTTYPLPKEFEIIIVDQNEEEDIYDLTEEDRRYNIRVLRESFDCLSEARNAGLRWCRGTFIGIPDDDCWYEEGFTDKLIDELRDALRDQHCVGVVLGWWVFSGFPSEKRRLKSREMLCYGNSGTLITKREAIDKFRCNEVFENRMSPGSSYPAGDETLFAARACKYGEGYYKGIPRVTVNHNVFEISKNRERLYAPGFGALAYSLLKLRWGPGIRLAAKIMVGPFIMMVIDGARGKLVKAEIEGTKALYRCVGFAGFGYQDIKARFGKCSSLVGG